MKQACGHDNGTQTVSEANRFADATSSFWARLALGPSNARNWRRTSDTLNHSWRRFSGVIKRNQAEGKQIFIHLRLPSHRMNFRWSTESFDCCWVKKSRKYVKSITPDLPPAFISVSVTYRELRWAKKVNPIRKPTRDGKKWLSVM